MQRPRASSGPEFATPQSGATLAGGDARPGAPRGHNCTRPLSFDRSLTNASLVAAARKMHRPRKTLAGERWKSPNPVSVDAYSRTQAGAGLIASPSTTQLEGGRSQKRAKWSRRRRKHCAAAVAGDPPLALAFAGCWRRHRFGCGDGDHCERERQMRQPMRPHQKHSSFACRLSHKVQLDANNDECNLTRGSR